MTRLQLENLPFITSVEGCSPLTRRSCSFNSTGFSPQIFVFLADSLSLSSDFFPSWCPSAASYPHCFLSLFADEHTLAFDRLHAVNEPPQRQGLAFFSLPLFCQKSPIQGANKRLRMLLSEEPPPLKQLEMQGRSAGRRGNERADAPQLSTAGR